MRTVKVNASKSYEIVIGAGLLTAPPESFWAKVAGRTVMIVSDDHVWPLYGEALRRLLAEKGTRAERFVFPHGEEQKDLRTYRELVEAMNAVPMTRSDLIIALGGGVVGDLAGFAAATYQRGIDFIQIPTSLLAAVDSSVGGKTGLDLATGKNQIGAFYQPVLVLCDVDTLETLPEAEYRNGCAEIIKYAMLGSEELFASIRETPVRDQYEEVIGACVSMKRDLVEQDEFDRGARMLLNFGHTVGHAVETLSGYSVPHGKAVAIGMAVMSRAAAKLGLLKEAERDALLSLLRQYELLAETEYPAELLASAMMKDKKKQGARLSVIVPERTGRCVIRELAEDEIPVWLEAGGLR